MKFLWLALRDLYSTKKILEAGDRLNINVESAEITDISFVSAGKKLSAFHQSRDIVKNFDVLIVRTFHPFISEALTLARLFSDAGKLVIDHDLTNRGYAVSKMHDYLLMAKAKIPVPKTWQYFKEDSFIKAAKDLGYPCVLKGTHGAKGQHVYKVSSAAAAKKLFNRYPPGELLVQEFLPAEEDYRVVVLGYKALPLFVARKPRRGDFRTNFEIGEQFEARELKLYPEIAAMATKSAKILGREFAAVDIRCRGSQPLVLEVNRRPNFEGFEQATGLDVAGTFLSYARRRAKLHFGR